MTSELYKRSRDSLTRIRTRLSFRSTSAIDSLLERDMTCVGVYCNGASVKLLLLSYLNLGTISNVHCFESSLTGEDVN